MVVAVGVVEGVVVAAVVGIAAVTGVAVVVGGNTPSKIVDGVINKSIVYNTCSKSPTDGSALSQTILMENTSATRYQLLLLLPVI